MGVIGAEARRLDGHRADDGELAAAAEGERATRVLEEDDALQRRLVRHAARDSS